MRIFLKSCDRCDLAGLERIPRTWWMRLLPKVRYYHCNQCGSNALAPKQLVESRHWMTTTMKNYTPIKPEKTES